MQPVQSAGKIVQAVQSAGKTCNRCKALESSQPAKSKEKHATDAKRGKKGALQVLALLEKCSVFFSMIFQSGIDQTNLLHF